MVATGAGLARQRREGDSHSGDAKSLRVYDRKPHGVRETGGSGRSSEEGEDRITSPEQRACGSVGGSNGHGCKVMASQEDMNTWTKAGDQENAKERSNARIPCGRAALKGLTSSRTGENPPYGMSRGGGGNDRHGLKTICHEARKGGNIGSLWPKLVAPPPYSTTGLDERCCDKCYGLDFSKLLIVNSF